MVVLFIDFYLESPILRITEGTFITSEWDWENSSVFLPWRTVDMCKYHGEAWNIKTGGKCRAHAQRCSCSLWGLLYNLFFYLEYQLFNPEQNQICAWLFLRSIPVSVLVSGEGDSQETPGLALTMCQCGSSPGLAYATGRPECLPPLQGSNFWPPSALLHRQDYRTQCSVSLGKHPLHAWEA